MAPPAIIHPTITYPNIARTPAAGLHRLRAADNVYHAKLRGYADNYIISASGATRMCIFAMESYGGLHKSSEALLRYLADSKYPGVGPGGSGDTDGLRARFIGTSRQRVSVACMKGNSTILQRFRKVCLRLTPAVPVV